jgi:hypothetical protein
MTLGQLQHAQRVLGEPGPSQGARRVRRVRRLRDRKRTTVECRARTFGHVSIYVAEEEDQTRQLEHGEQFELREIY